jgi:hypothetical protein
VAQDVRPRAAVALACLLAATACRGRETPQQPATGRPAPAPAPRAVDVATLPADQVVDAVLRECHGPLRGQMAHVAATVTLPDGAALQLFAELPDKLRVQSPAGRFLLVGDAVTRLDALPAPGSASAAEAGTVRALGTLLDAAAFGPLHRATGCRRVDATTFALEAPGAPPVTMALRPGTLLPASFARDGATTMIHDYLHTGTTWIARELELAPLGRCRVTFEAQIDWEPGFFTVPAAPAGATAQPPAGAQRLPMPGNNPEARPPAPVAQAVKALQWIVVADPGDWPGRVAAYRPLHEELERQQQLIAGFPVFFTENGEALLAAPFRQRANGRAFAPPAGWRVRAIDAGTWLVVFPPDGDLAQRLAAGERMLQDALRAQQRTAKGPITAQPYFHLHEGEPPPAKLAAPTVRMAVRVD